MPDNTETAPLHRGAVDSALTKILRGMNGIGTLWIFAFLLLINADVVGRNVFNDPIDGVIEMVELSIVAVVFLQLGDATRVGRLTRSDGFFRLILRRAPRVGRRMGALFDLLGALFMFFILYGTFPLMTEAWKYNHYVGNVGVFKFPTWPVKLIVVLGCLATMLLFLSLAWRWLRPGDPPEGERGEFVAGDGGGP